MSFYTLFFVLFVENRHNVRSLLTVNANSLPAMAVASYEVTKDQTSVKISMRKRSPKSLISVSYTNTHTPGPGPGSGIGTDPSSCRIQVIPECHENKEQIILLKCNTTSFKQSQGQKFCPLNVVAEFCLICIKLYLCQTVERYEINIYIYNLTL